MIENLFPDLHPTDLPGDDVLYAALLARDPAWDGRAYVAVASTGVFCRLTCPARKPKQANCRFHAEPAACLAAGYRPCLRCRPLGEPDPLVTRLVDALAAEPERRWSEADLHAMRLDPSTVRRAFKRQFGRSFLDLARERRLRAGFTTLRTGAKVIEAQLDAGFESASAFRDAFARLLGLSPGALRSTARLMADWIETPLGAMLAVSDAKALYLLEFLDRKALPGELKRLSADAHGDIGLGCPQPTQTARRALAAYFDGTDARLDVPIATGGSAFARAVWAALRQIPAGETRSYGQLARGLGRPTATRAVARANGANRIALIVPCHRVIGADGGLTGYGGGIWRKDRLLALERHYQKQETPS